MKLIPYLHLVLSTAQLLLAHVPNDKTFLYIDTDIKPTNLQIPENSYWKGSPARTRPLDRWFESIEFKKNITKARPIRIDYIVQSKVTTWYGWSYWEDVDYGREMLCDTEKKDSSVGELVRRLLGIPGGCPVIAGEIRKTENKFPMNLYHLSLDGETFTYDTRILATAYGPDSVHTFSTYPVPLPNLFTGTFYLVYPVGGGYVYDN